MDEEKHLELVEWLNGFAPEFQDLSKEELFTIMQFSLLWSFFEAEVLNNQASSNRIIEHVKVWSQENLLELNIFEDELNYFKNRYFKNNNLTYRFNHLHLRANDNPDLVKDVLSGKNENNGDIVSSLLIIVYRYRNNFFHGIKWDYLFSEQLQNFQHANNLLKKSIQIDRKCKF